MTKGIFKHPKLENFVKHEEGNVFVECDIHGNVLKSKRSWQMGGQPTAQHRIITDTTVLKRVDAVRRAEVDSMETFLLWAKQMMFQRHSFYANGKDQHLSPQRDMGFKLIVTDKLPDRVLGRCNSSDRVIYMSKQYIELNVKDNTYYVTDTMLHEIAHAFQYYVYTNVNTYKNGRWIKSIKPHGIEWQRIARQIGAMPKATKNLAALNMSLPKSKYTQICDSCGNETPMHRKTNRSHSCGRCDSVYNPKYKLRTVQNF